MYPSSQQENCVIDARVSTPKQLAGFSLDDQEIQCTNLANRNNWNILEIYSKPYSGTKEEREDFEKILKDIQIMQLKGIKVDHYVIKSIDRFTRLGSGGYHEMKTRLRALGVQLVDVYGVIQPETNELAHLGIEYPWSVQSPTSMAQTIEAERAKKDVQESLVKMIGAEISLTQRGYKARGANDGFVNKEVFVEGKSVKIQVRDPERAKYYEKMYELRARGDITDEDIVEQINAMGYLSKDKKRWQTSGKTRIVIGAIPGKPLTVKHLQKVIQKLAYVGITCEKWTLGKPIWSHSESLVDIGTFNKANRGKVFVKMNEDGSPEVLYGYSKSEKTIKRRNRYNPLFKYDKMICCHKCHKPFKSSSSTGKSGKSFPAYHCERGHGRVSDNKKNFENNVSNFLRSIEIKGGFLKAFEMVLINKYREREAEITETSAKMSKNVSNLKAEQASLMRSFTQADSSVMRKKLEEQVEDLELRINKATEKRNQIEINEKDIKSFVKYAKNLMEHPVKMLMDNSNPVVQGQLFNLVFDGMPTYEEILNGTPKLSFVFKLSEQFNTSKTVMATPRGVEPRLPE